MHTYAHARQTKLIIEKNKATPDYRGGSVSIASLRGIFCCLDIRVVGLGKLRFGSTPLGSRWHFSTLGESWGLGKTLTITGKTGGKQFQYSRRVVGLGKAFPQKHCHYFDSFSTLGESWVWVRFWLCQSQIRRKVSVLLASRGFG
jgi:hypothetical protein